MTVERCFNHERFITRTRPLWPHLSKQPFELNSINTYLLYFDRQDRGPLDYFIIFILVCLKLVIACVVTVCFG